jgi:hypothetical protein
MHDGSSFGFYKYNNSIIIATFFGDYNRLTGSKLMKLSAKNNFVLIFSGIGENSPKILGKFFRPSKIFVSDPLKWGNSLN